MKFTNIRWALLCFLIVLVPNSVMAQLDSGPDGIGIYFDQEATSVSTTAAAGDVVQAWLIATNLTHAGEMGMWDTYICPDGGYADVSGTPTHGGYNYSMNMPGDMCWSCTTFAFNDEPFPTANITVLASLSIMIYDDLGPINLFLHSDSSTYWVIDGGDDGFPLYPSSGSFDVPVATINGPGPVVAESSEWGTVKAMYR